MGESAVTADDAFENLIARNAFGIPVVSRRDDGEPRTDSPPAAKPRRNVEVVRVEDVVGPVGDYSPRRYDEDTAAVFATPTEADLDAIADEDVAAARDEGALILGRDADLGYGTGLSDGGGLRAMEDFPGEDDDQDEAALHRARRVRRFAYLPLGGMEGFETRARDIMARLASRDPGRQSLAITGPALGSGETELAVRLALAVAKRVDYRILLADFDVRKPQVGPRLGVSSKYFTIADVLRGSCRVGEALVFSEEDNLYVLPARASDRDGDEFLDDRQVRQLVTRLHAAFDFIVCCCGSMEHADAVTVCRHAGATALAGFCNHTRSRALREAARRLSKAGANVSGLLLTGAS